MEQRKHAARRRRMARVLLGIIGFGGLAFAAGIGLPAEHRSTARGTFDRPPEAVWGVLTDLDGLPMWRSDVVRVERLPQAGGRTLWREVLRGEEHVIELAESDPPRRLVTHRRQEGRPALPERTFHLRATLAGTVVTVTEREKVGNPIGRVLVRLGATMSPAARLLRDLEIRLNPD